MSGDCEAFPLNILPERRRNARHLDPVGGEHIQARRPISDRDLALVEAARLDSEQTTLFFEDASIVGLDSIGFDKVDPRIPSYGVNEDEILRSPGILSQITHLVPPHSAFLHQTMSWMKRFWVTKSTIHLEKRSLLVNYQALKRRDLI